jgi:hypothetical protein
MTTRKKPQADVLYTLVVGVLHKVNASKQGRRFWETTRSSEPARNCSCVTIAATARSSPPSRTRRVWRNSAARSSPRRARLR